MEHTFATLSPGGGPVALFSGIDLFYTDPTAGLSAPGREASAHILEIHYCRAGQVAWETAQGGSVFLNPGDFSLHTRNACPDPAFRFPTGQYQGLTISVDLREASAHPPEMIAEAELFSLLREKFCLDSAAAFFAGNQQTEGIFGGFFGQPERLKRSYQRVKALELFLYLAGTEAAPPDCLAEYPSEQLRIVREIHDQLLQHMERRITIEELSRQYLINPTTLKTAFKAVYGTSLAAHMKKHRMEQAEKLLRETDMSIAGIAQAVGYDSQSKFTAAFKESFQVLPREYRKRLSTTGG